MRKLVLPLMISLVILCGCADSGEESFMQFMQQVSAANEIGFDALVRAEYSDKTAEFKLGYTQDENGAVVEIKEPELIAGIKARVLCCLHRGSIGERNCHCGSRYSLPDLRCRLGWGR